MIYFKKQKTFLTAKKAAGFPIFYRTPPALMWQGFGPPHSAICRTEHLARTAKNPENRRGFPFYSSGASNPKGSGAQYCSPPHTVLGIETWRSNDGILSRPYIAALHIPFSVLKLHTGTFQLLPAHHIAALHIPFSVLKQQTPFQPRCHTSYCSPPHTVLGIETILECVTQGSLSIAALHIPFSVLKRGGNIAISDWVYHCSPPHTVLGIETSWTRRTSAITMALQPSTYRSRY